MVSPSGGVLCLSSLVLVALSVNRTDKSQTWCSTIWEICHALPELFSFSGDDALVLGSDKTA